VVGDSACNLVPDQAWSINVTGTQTVLMQASKAGLQRLVFVSTCSNYGMASPDALATEESPLNPLSLYARAKVEAERLVLGISSPPHVIVLRLGTICGLSPRMRFDLLVSEMALKAARGKRIEIYAPDAWRPFLHINDAGRAIGHILHAVTETNAGRVFNVVGENYQKHGLVELVRRHFPGTEIATVAKKPDLRDYRVDATRITRELGYSTWWTVEDAFLETAHAVAMGVFRDPEWAGHSAIPLDSARVRP
jgi:nucleoside-diphosphate-sugar epimerase